jgi:hypothetical protein
MKVAGMPDTFRTTWAWLPVTSTVMVPAPVLPLTWPKVDWYEWSAAIAGEPETARAAKAKVGTAIRRRVFFIE